MLSLSCSSLCFLCAPVKIEQLHMLDFHLKLINYSPLSPFSYQELHILQDFTFKFKISAHYGNTGDNMDKINIVISITVYFLYQYKHNIYFWLITKPIVVLGLSFNPSISSSFENICRVMMFPFLMNVKCPLFFCLAQ